MTRSELVRQVALQTESSPAAADAAVKAALEAVAGAGRFGLAQTARTCIYGHLEERDAVDPAASHLEMDDNVPGRDYEPGRLVTRRASCPALAL